MQDSEPLEAWLAEMREQAVEVEDWDEKRLVWSFPSDDVLDEFLSTASERDQGEVDFVLDCLLIPSCALGKDHFNYERFVESVKRGDPQKNESYEYKNWHFQRVVGYYAGFTDIFPWEGIKWVTQLLPDSPRVALAAIDAYILAHMYDMHDSLVWAMADAKAVIRARYIGVPESQDLRRKELYTLSGRQFECLIDRLFSEIGYETELTPPRRDGGRDVVGRRKEAGGEQYALIECKRHKANIRVKDVRALLGVVSNERVNTGIIVTASGFTRGAKELAKENRRVQLIDGLRLVVMLNEHLGWTWPSRVDWLADENNRAPRDTASVLSEFR
jgi:restriction system protein